MQQNNRNLPAKRYDLFIKAFEKKVAEAQERIRLLDRLMRPYEICREALEAALLENDSKLEMSFDGRSISVTIAVLPTDREGFADKVIQGVGRGLKAASLHSTGEPIIGKTSYDFCYDWALQSFDPPVRIKVTLDVPIHGTPFIEIAEVGRFTVPATDIISTEPRWRQARVEDPLKQPIAPGDEIPF